MKGKILVTGGTGYIGSHTTVELIESGYEVVVVDNLSNSQASVIDRIEQITGLRPQFFNFDLCDRSALENCLKSAGKIDGIIHFAASKAVGESVENPLLYYRNNISSLINLLEGMNQYGISNIVFSSSCTVYGQPQKLPVDENTPIPKAQSPYGNTKQICEEILQDAAKAHPSLNVISLRYFNPVGAHNSALIGELPNGVPSNLVPFITQTAAGLRSSLKVFGSDYDTHDGTAVRDYIHVVDLAQAHVRTLQLMLSKEFETQWSAYNLGTGVGYSVLDVIKSFEAVTDVKLNYEMAPRRPGDIEKIYADATRANEELKWKAERSLDDMMRSAWAWQKSLQDSASSR